MVFPTILSMPAEPLHLVVDQPLPLPGTPPSSVSPLQLPRAPFAAGFPGFI